ncbi:hypothetical protein [Andreprevotia chitinilytica]|uniref:hypothetical protein n=1 Tax=Andreprevotia chitinilytica TaxID=396808 RepID=UPI001B80960B|nr:hypothetical protein [Andreprevotia chitinilytica]
MRHSIDDYRADHGNNPQSIQTLVTDKYIRDVPVDPITGRSDTWVENAGEESGVRDVHSGATGKALDGSDYAQW